MHQPTLAVQSLSKTFPVRGGWWPSANQQLQALDDISFTLNSGETLGIVGESGCGKSTLGRCILDLLAPSSGEVWLDGKPIRSLEQRQFRSRVQIIFQDPLASLDPRMSVGDIIAEPLIALRPHLNNKQRQQLVSDLMAEVGLLPEMIHRFPHEFSGGQAQRIGIARALISEPDIIVCDEPVSALDVSIQAQILNLLKKLKQSRRLSLIFISHDLAVIRHIADKVMVLYLGRIMELASNEQLFAQPQHPYTQSLLAAVPVADPQLARQRQYTALEGEIPSALHPPSGCAFHSRCPQATARCSQQRPLLLTTGDKHQTACLQVPALD